MTIAVTSALVSAYFSRLRRNTISGRHSRSLCGPADGRGAYCDVMDCIEQTNRNNRARISRWNKCYPCAGELVKHPVLGRIETLQVLSRSSLLYMYDFSGLYAHLGSVRTRQWPYRHDCVRLVVGVEVSVERLFRKNRDKKNVKQGKSPFSRRFCGAARQLRKTIRRAKCDGIFLEENTLNLETLTRKN
jgi:hypothetical protein